MNAGRPRARIESASRSAFSSLTNAPIWTRHTGSVCSTPRFSMRRSAPLVTGTVYRNRRPCSAASRPSPSRLLASPRVTGPDGRNASAGKSRREDQPFDELASRDLLVRVKRLIRKQVDDVTAEQKLDTVFRPVAANIDRAWRLRPCGQSGSSGSDEDDDRDDAHGARNT